MKLPLRKKELHFPLTVHVCAEALGCSPSLLRHYEREGVVQPIRDSDNRRLYLPDDLEKLRDHRALLAHDGEAIAKFREQRRAALGKEE